MNSQSHSTVMVPVQRSAETAGEFVLGIADMLRTRGILSAELDARLIVCHACGLTHEQFAARPEQPLSDHERGRIMQTLRRRCAREPLSRIFGAREFWSLEFEICPHTLDPRPDTETLVRAALELTEAARGSEPLSILDLGTGSGCVLVSLLHELSAAVGVGTDVCAETLALARANAERHGVDGRARFVCASWGEGLDGAFDLVVANPPYVPTGDLSSLEPEVARFDPRRALDGGADGLAAYRQIMPALSSLLVPGGWAIFEVGTGQAVDVAAMFRRLTEKGSFGRARQWSDLSGHMRCVAAKRSPTL